MSCAKLLPCSKWFSCTLSVSSIGSSTLNVQGLEKAFFGAFARKGRNDSSLQIDGPPRQQLTKTRQAEAADPEQLSRSGHCRMQWRGTSAAFCALQFLMHLQNVHLLRTTSHRKARALIQVNPSLTCTLSSPGLLQGSTSRTRVPSLEHAAVVGIRHTFLLTAFETSKLETLSLSPRRLEPRRGLGEA